MKMVQDVVVTHISTAILHSKRQYRIGPHPLYTKLLRRKYGGFIAALLTKDEFGFQGLYNRPSVDIIGNNGIIKTIQCKSYKEAEQVYAEIIEALEIS